jgi:protein-disulfide isomerase
MTQKSNGGKIVAIVVVLIIAAAAVFGYSRQSSEMKKTSQEAAIVPTKNETVAILTPKPNDIILGDPNALVTIVEYSSLSCPHCAHFHKEVLPDIEKEFITTGKAKLVIRHFPLNDPALKAAELVECAGSNGVNRANFEKILFNMQTQWAVNADYLKQLKQIALVGGIDSATFESCTTDKDLETRIIASREEAGDKLGVNSTPTFFINNTKLEGDTGIDSFRKAINDAQAPKPEAGNQPAPVQDAPKPQAPKAAAPVAAPVEETPATSTPDQDSTKE